MAREAEQGLSGAQEGTLAFLASGFPLWGWQEDELPPRRGVGEGMRQGFLLAWFSGHRCL